MKIITFISFLALASSAVGQAGGILFHTNDVTSTTPDPPLRVFSPARNPFAKRIVNEHFTFVADLRKMDAEVLKVFYSKVPSADIANRGGRFNPTDVGPGLRRRFVLAGTSSQLWFILYESGGIGYHHNLVVFSKNSEWHVVAAVAGFLKGKGDTFELLKAALNKGEFFDQKGYPQY